MTMDPREIDRLLDAFLAGEEVPEGFRDQVRAAVRSGDAAGAVAARIRHRTRIGASYLAPPPGLRAHLEGLRTPPAELPAGDPPAITPTPTPTPTATANESDLTGDLREYAARVVERLKSRAEDQRDASPDGDDFSKSILVSILDSVFRRIQRGRVRDDNSLLATLIEVAYLKYEARHPGGQPAEPVSPSPSLGRLKLLVPEAELPDEVCAEVFSDCQRLLENAPSPRDLRIRILALEECDDAEIARDAEVGLAIPQVRTKIEVARSWIEANA